MKSSKKKFRRSKRSSRKKRTYRAAAILNQYVNQKASYDSAHPNYEETKNKIGNAIYESTKGKPLSDWHKELMNEAILRADNGDWLRQMIPNMNALQLNNAEREIFKRILSKLRDREIRYTALRLMASKDSSLNALLTAVDDLVTKTQL